VLPRALRPRWLAWHGALVVVLVAFIALGMWQIESFKADDAPRRTSNAVPLQSVSTPGGRIAAMDVGRSVTAMGTYQKDRQLFVPGRAHGDREGFLVATPLRTADGIVVVTRGWVAKPSDPAAEVPAGPVSVTGVLAPSESEQDSALDPLADLPPDQVPYIATVQVLDALPYRPDEVYDGQVVLTAQVPATRPAPAQVEPRLPDDGVSRWRNLAYGLQWWLFAGVAIFFWWMVLRRAARDSRGPDAPAVVDDADQPADQSTGS
jgi:cytochrome oxidase assembly protein ShyY1